MKSSLTALLALALCLPGAVSGAGLEVTAESMRRADLPNNFPFQILHEGFAVVRIRLHNPSTAEQTPDLAGLSVRGPKNQKIKRALPTEITPRLVKYYQGGNLGIVGEAHAGGRPNAAELQRAPVVGVQVPTGSIDVSTGTRLRQILESFELVDAPLAGGESREGFIYLKSKRSGTHLRGGSVRLGESEAVIP